jgi:hypothetical protein
VCKTCALHFPTTFCPEVFELVRRLLSASGRDPQQNLLTEGFADCGKGRTFPYGKAKGLSEGTAGAKVDNFHLKLSK